MSVGAWQPLEAAAAGWRGQRLWSSAAAAHLPAARLLLPPLLV